MIENGPLVRKLAFLAIFTIPHPTKPYQTNFKLGPANSMEKKMTENRPSVGKLVFLAIYAIPYPTKPYQTCVNV